MGQRSRGLQEGENPIARGDRGMDWGSGGWDRGTGGRTGII